MKIVYHIDNYMIKKYQQKHFLMFQYLQFLSMVQTHGQPQWSHKTSVTSGLIWHTYTSMMYIMNDNDDKYMTV